MESHLLDRPQKRLYSEDVVKELREKAVNFLKDKLLPNNKIIKIVLIGSSVKNCFGEYEPPGFRDSLYSDFDFIVFVNDDYEIPIWFKREPRGKPFPDDKDNLAFRNTKVIEDKYDIEVFFIRESNFERLKELGEEAGIPMSSESKHKNKIVYSKY